MKCGNPQVDEQRTIWSEYWKSQNRIDPKSILNSEFTQKAYRSIKNFINKKDKLILEAGCGTGRLCCLLAKDFPDSQVNGLDISSNSLKIAGCLKDYLQVSNVIFEMGNLFQMPYSHNSFDLVFNEGVIEHYSLNSKPNYLDAIREMMRITKKGGKIIVAVPNWYNFPHTFYKWILAKLGENYIYGYEKSFKHSELIKIFSELGLINCEIYGFFPAHGFYRLSGRGAQKLLFFVGRLTNKLESFFDNHLNGKFSKLFGIEIVIKGEKT